MVDDSLRSAIRDHFSGATDAAHVWRGFDLFLDVDRFLNLGYSEWYQPHALASSQRRLVERVGSGLGERLSGGTQGRRTLDLGCGRGGPAIVLEERFGLAVVGIDLVPHNVTIARENARRAGATASFAVGDATALPVRSASFDAATLIDSIAYVPERGDLFAELRRTLTPGGIVAASDLLVADGLDARERAAVSAFGDAWNMPPLDTASQRRAALETAGLSVDAMRDVSQHSIDGFRKWARLYLGAVEHAGPVMTRALGRLGLDESAITRQVRTAVAALDHLRHVIVYARRPRDGR